MIIDSVSVKNFRSYGEATLRPMHEGITTITGTNGAGKSSICTHAIVWCLFGQTPDGVSVKELRRQAAPDGEPTEVTVTLHIDGKELTVYRAMKGKALTTVASASLDGVEHADIKSNAVTTFVEATLGMDATAFLTAFMVRQKELDALVRQTAAARKKTIEKLAGITRLQSAVDEARLNLRTLKAAVDAIPAVDDADLDSMQARLSLLDDEIAAAAATAALSAKRASTATAEWKTASEALREAEKQTREALQARELNANLHARIDAAAAKIERGETALQEASIQADKAASELAALVAQWPANTPITITPLDDLNERIGMLRGERTSTKNTLTALDDNAANCPTCGQPADTSNLKTTLATRLQEITEEGKTLATEIETITTRNQQAALIQAAQQTANQAASEQTRIQTKLDTTRTEHATLTSQLQTTSNPANPIDNNTLTLLTQAATDTQHTMETAREQSEQAARTNATLATQHATLKTQITHTQENATARRHALTEYETANILATTLDKYRAQRLAALAPALAESASDYLTTLTAGAFIGIDLSEDFEPSVIDAARHVRPVSMLSGGEESLVALALRLAIGDEVIDGTGSLLVLDEILGAMDEDRRRLIMTALRGLSRQIVMVNHLPEQGGDYSVEAIPGHDGSTLREEGGE